MPALQGAIKELCLVVEADAPTGMGGIFKVNTGGTLAQTARWISVVS